MILLYIIFYFLFYTVMKSHFSLTYATTNNFDNDHKEILAAVSSIRLNLPMRSTYC